MAMGSGTTPVRSANSKDAGHEGSVVAAPARRPGCQHLQDSGIPDEGVLSPFFLPLVPSLFSPGYLTPAPSECFFLGLEENRAAIVVRRGQKHPLALHPAQLGGLQVHAHDDLTTDQVLGRVIRL